MKGLFWTSLTEYKVFLHMSIKNEKSVRLADYKPDHRKKGKMHLHRKLPRKCNNISCWMATAFLFSVHWAANFIAENGQYTNVCANSAKTSANANTIKTKCTQKLWGISRIIDIIFFHHKNNIILHMNPRPCWNQYVIFLNLQKCSEVMADSIFLYL